MKRILVTGAGGSAGINFIDSLRMAAERMHIVGTDSNKWHLELPDVNSRYILPRCPGKDYIDKLNRVIEKEKIEFVHPQPDVEVKVISENREKINALTYLPQVKTIEICQNKLKLNELLAKKDIPVPRSIPIRRVEDLDNAINELKGRQRRIWLRAVRGAGARASLPIQTAEHGEMWIDYWHKTAGLGYDDFMACEFLPGKEFAFQSLWENGELITSAARERLEYIFGELTPSGQSSSPSVARVVRRDDVNEIAAKAILVIDDKATGVFCVDLKENIKGIPCITEVNSGRFFTTSNFFASLGANMPYTYIKLAYKTGILELPKYNAVPDGCYWIRLMDKGPLLIKEGTWRSRVI